MLIALLFVKNNCLAMFELNLQKRAENRIFKNINDVRFKEFRNTFSKRFNYDFEAKKFGSLRPDGKGSTIFREEKLNDGDKKLIADYQRLAESRKKEIARTYNNGECPNFNGRNCAAGIGATAVGIWSTGFVVSSVRDFMRAITKPDDYVPNYSDLRIAFLCCGIAYLSYRSITTAFHYINAGLNYKNYLWRQQQEIGKICDDFNQMQLLVHIKQNDNSREGIN
jgi:hypothetical protein